MRPGGVSLSCYSQMHPQNLRLPLLPSCTWVRLAPLDKLMNLPDAVTSLEGAGAGRCELHRSFEQQCIALQLTET